MNSAEKSETKFNYTFTIDQVNMLLDALAELQYKKASPLIEEIRMATILQIKDRSGADQGN